MKVRIALVLVFLVVGTAVVFAAKTPAERDITFSSATRIGEVLIPAGTYIVTHVEEGGQHVMIFKKNAKAAEYRVKCTLQPLAEKVTRTEQHYRTGDGGEHLLRELVFAGDTVKHVFR